MDAERREIIVRDFMIYWPQFSEMFNAHERLCSCVRCRLRLRLMFASDLANLFSPYDEGALELKCCRQVAFFAARNFHIISCSVKNMIEIRLYRYSFHCTDTL